MKLEIRELKKEDFAEFKEGLSSFRANNLNSKNFPSWPLLQSDYWANFQENFTDKVSMFSVYQGNKKIAFFLSLEKKVVTGQKYWYLPRGPMVFEDYQGDFWADFLSALKNLGKERGLSFVRLEPLNFNKDESFFKKLAIRKTKAIQPKNTSFIDLSLGEEGVLRKMSQKTRYNIRLAEKKGVEVFSVHPSENGFMETFEVFWNLINTTAKRDKFFIHSKDYYRKMIDGQVVRLMEARFSGEVLASGIFSFYDETVTYLHGASSNNKRNLMAPHLLQWRAIKKALEEGFAYYDFYGIDEKKWPGVTRFKKGFCGNEYRYPGAFDLVIKKNSYLFYNLFRRVIRLKSLLKL